MDQVGGVAEGRRLAAGVFSTERPAPRLTRSGRARALEDLVRDGVRRVSVLEGPSETREEILTVDGLDGRLGRPLPAEEARHVAEARPLRRASQYEILGISLG